MPALKPTSTKANHEATRLNEVKQLLDLDLEENNFVLGSKRPWEVNTVLSAAVSFQRSDLLKKTTATRSELAKKHAIEKWHAANTKCSVQFNEPPLDHPLALAYGLAKDYFRSLVLDQSSGNAQELRYPILPENGKFGPGSSLLCDNETLACKTAFATHTFTEVSLRNFYRESLVGNPRAMAIDLCREYTYGSERVRASKLTTVPKSDKIDRVICIEPLLNMFFQQAVRSSLEACLRRVGIDFNTQQEYQKFLARKGSLDGTLATVDLSSASDTISLSFVEKFCPVALTEMLVLGRCESTTIDGEEQTMFMVSSMGNATTFPLETAIFLSLCVGALRSLDIPFATSGNGRTLGVFGDDIVIDVRACEVLYALLELCGFSVNEEKSFHAGRFRESCGGNYFAGHDVTPVRITDLKTRNDYFSAYNRLLSWGARHSIFLPRTLAYLYNGVNPEFRFAVPVDSSVDAGFFSAYGSKSRSYKAYVPVPRYVRLAVHNPDFQIGVCLLNVTQDDKGFKASLRKSLGYKLSRQWYPGFFGVPEDHQDLKWSRCGLGLSPSAAVISAVGSLCTLNNYIKEMRSLNDTFFDKCRGV